ncbi:holin [Bacillus infantis]|uniref:holin n=1 Tax=Bacillus infantis TaxID=324767 RepID=UPI00101C3F0A|nr:holin [Bacillus infantis]RYI24992.1 holin [Bacillus infantis]
MKRFKNYALWLAVAAFIPLLADSLGVYDISIVLPENYEKVTAALLGILVLAGVINNPSDGTGFKDNGDK